MLQRFSTSAIEPYLTRSSVGPSEGVRLPPTRVRWIGNHYGKKNVVMISHQGRWYIVNFDMKIIPKSVLGGAPFASLADLRLPDKQIGTPDCQLTR